MAGEEDEIHDLLPRPDPSRLTTDQLRRELRNLRELIETRLEAGDRARELLLQLMDEREAHIGRRFAERDERFSERDKDRQAAVQAALDAATALSDARDLATDKASDKFELSIREQLAQLTNLAAANRDLLDGKIDALRQRIDRSDAATDALAAQRTLSDRQQALRLTISAIAISAIVVIVNVLLYVLSHR